MLNFVQKKDIHMRSMLRNSFIILFHNRFAEIYNEKVYDLLNNCNDSLSIINSGDDVIVKGLSERRVFTVFFVESYRFIED